MARIGQKLGTYAKVGSIDERRIRAIIRCSPSLEYKSLFAFLYLAGMRISEALSLTKQDFSVKGQHLVVNVRRLKRKDHPAIPLIIPLSAEFMPYIWKWLMQVEGKVWSMTRTEAWKVLKEIDPKMTLHSFRRSRANFFAEYGDGNPYRLCSWFGWKRLETSMEYIEKHGKLAQGLAPLLEESSHE